MACCVPGVKTVGGVQIYNDNEPVGAGWQIKFCGFIPIGPAFSGIPEGTPRLEESEEQAILKRWYGHWKIVQLSDAPKNTILMATDAFVDGNILAMRGGNVPEQDGDYGVWVNTSVKNAPRKQRFSLWRGADGVLYLDNIGSRLVSETPSELTIKNAINLDLTLTRTVVAPVAPIQSVMERAAAPAGALEVASVPVEVRT